MKIVFIGGRDIHKLGGIESYMYNLCTELVKMGHEPLVFCESDRNETEQINGFTVIHQKSINSRKRVSLHATKAPSLLRVLTPEVLLVAVMTTSPPILRMFTMWALSAADKLPKAAVSRAG